MKMEVRGTPAKGRPRMKWMDNIRHDMNKCSLEEGDTQDRGRWRRVVQNPTWQHHFFLPLFRAAAILNYLIQRVIVKDYGFGLR